MSGDGAPDPRVCHRACPVPPGHRKFGCNVWIADCTMGAPKPNPNPNRTRTLILTLTLTLTKAEADAGLRARCLTPGLYLAHLPKLSPDGEG